MGRTTEAIQVAAMATKYQKVFERRLKDEYSVYIYNYRNAGNGRRNNVCIMQGK